MARIEHFALFTDDLERLRDFYVATMGLKVVLDNSQAPVAGYFLGDDRGTMLEIIARPAGTPGAETRYVCHAAFWVEDFDAAKSALAAQGATFETGTVVETPEFRTVFFRDPAQNRLQIVWRAKPLT